MERKGKKKEHKETNRKASENTFTEFQTVIKIAYNKNRFIPSILLR